MDKRIEQLIAGYERWLALGLASAAAKKPQASRTALRMAAHRQRVAITVIRKQFGVPPSEVTRLPPLWGAARFYYSAAPSGGRRGVGLRKLSRFRV